MTVKHGCSSQDTHVCVCLCAQHAGHCLHPAAQPGAHLWHQGRCSRRRVQPGNSTQGCRVSLHHQQQAAASDSSSAALPPLRQPHCCAVLAATTQPCLAPQHTYSPVVSPQRCPCNNTAVPAPQSSAHHSCPPQQHSCLCTSQLAPHHTHIYCLSLYLVRLNTPACPCRSSPWRSSTCT